MQTADAPVPANPFARADTMFGVCQALGEDLGFPPTLLRIAFAIGLFFSPLMAIGGYAAAGLLVLASRLLFPAPRDPSAETAETEAQAVTSDADAPAPEMAIAA